MGTIRNPWEKVRLEYQVSPMDHAVRQNSARDAAESAPTRKASFRQAKGGRGPAGVAGGVAKASCASATELRPMSGTDLSNNDMPALELSRSYFSSASWGPLFVGRIARGPR